MRLLADEHVPPAVVSALRGDGHDVAVVGEDLPRGSEDGILLRHARDTDRYILSEDTDFRGAEPELTAGEHPGILALDTAAPAAEIAAAIRQIDIYTDNLTATIVYVPGNWL